MAREHDRKISDNRNELLTDLKNILDPIFEKMNKSAVANNIALVKEIEHVSCLVSFLKANSSPATKAVDHVSKVIDTISWATQESYKKLNFIERRIMWFAPDDNEVIRQNLNAFDDWLVELAD